MAEPKVIALTGPPMHPLHGPQPSMTCLNHSGKVYSATLDFYSECEPYGALFACDIPDGVLGKDAKKIASQHAIPLFATIFPQSDSK